ncbi:MAG TPA: D-alanine--D-alanine ligase family protein [bacterium]|mgnify:CR=1 FL=1|nr:D-alanine--D-alanine ligase family protein [bacterium]
MRVAVLFGGKSTEHDVSIASAYAVMRWIERIPEYEAIPVYVTRAGKFVHHPAFKDIRTYQDVRKILEESDAVKLMAECSGSSTLRFVEERVGLLTKRRTIEADVAFPVFHGLGGEDGSMQGFLEMLGVPYVGPGILASAVGINKIIMKDVFASLGLPIVKHRICRFGETVDDEALIAEIGFPMFVKPARLGSTIGVSMVRNRDELEPAFEIAFHYDRDVVVEAGVPNVMELNCSVTEIAGEIVTSAIENPVSKGGYLTFDEKYMATDGATMTGDSKTVNIPAPIPESIAEDVRRYSRIIFDRFFAGGGAPRIDYLYDQEAGNLYVNEINTIPGTLQIHLWKASGVPETEFLRGLIDTAFRDHERRERNIDFTSGLLENTIRFAKK